MNDTSSKEFRARVHTVLAGIILAAAYASGFILNFLNAAETHVRISLWNTVLAFFSSWRTLLLFPVFILIFSVSAAWFADRKWKEQQRNDGMGRDFRHSKDASPYGDARFLQPHEYLDAAQIRPVENCKGRLLGQLGEDGRECIDFNPTDPTINSHMMVIGMSGCGKTFTFVKPYIFQSVKARHSLILTDPDGGLYEDMSGYLRDNGYVVRCLNLKSLRKSDGWDVLKTLRGENLSTNVQIFAKTVISNISAENNIYSSGSSSLLCALILRVLLCHDYPEEEKNIRSVFDLLQDEKGLKHLDTRFAEVSVFPEEEKACLAPYSAFKRASENLSANIATHLANGLQLLQDRLLCDVLSTDDMDLTLPGRQPCAYFAQFPDSHQTYRFIVSLFFSMLFINLVDYADLHTKDRRLEIPVDFLLDEFPSIGVIPDWDSKMAVVRKRGISCVMIIQDLPQLKTRYEETWPTIIDNCGTIVTLGINEPNETAEYISRLIGQASVEVLSTSETQNREGSRRGMLTNTSVSTGVGKRDLLSPAEICRLTGSDSLILIAHRYPIFAKKTPYTLFRDAEKLYVTKPGSVTDFQNKAERKLFRDAEKSYLESYWKNHDPHPDLHPEDVSDALYPEGRVSPSKAALRILRGDVEMLRKTIPDHHDPNAGKRSETLDNPDFSLSEYPVQKYAFQLHYEDYRKTHSGIEPEETEAEKESLDALFSSTIRCFDPTEEAGSGAGDAAPPAEKVPEPAKWEPIYNMPISGMVARTGGEAQTAKESCPQEPFSKGQYVSMPGLNAEFLTKRENHEHEKE